VTHRGPFQPHHAGILGNRSHCSLLGDNLLSTKHGLSCYPPWPSPAQWVSRQGTFAESSVLEKTSDHQAQPPTQPHHACSTMSPRTTPTRCLNPSRDGDSTTALGSLGQGLTTLAGKKFFLISNLNLLTQLEAIASRPVAGYLGEETNPRLTTISCQGAGESEKVSPQPPLLQTQQPQLPQPLPIRLVLQTPPQPRCPSFAFFLQFSPLFNFKENFSSAAALFYLAKRKIRTANPSSPNLQHPASQAHAAGAEGSSWSSNHPSNTPTDSHIAIFIDKAPVKRQLAARARQAAFLPP